MTGPQVAVLAGFTVLQQIHRTLESSGNASQGENIAEVHINIISKLLGQTLRVLAGVHPKPSGAPVRSKLHRKKKYGPCISKQLLC